MFCWFINISSLFFLQVILRLILMLENFLCIFSIWACKTNLNFRKIQFFAPVLFAIKFQRFFFNNTNDEILFKWLLILHVKNIMKKGAFLVITGMSILKMFHISFLSSFSVKFLSRDAQFSTLFNVQFLYTFFRVRNVYVMMPFETLISRDDELFCWLKCDFEPWNLLFSWFFSSSFFLFVLVVLLLVVVNFKFSDLSFIVEFLSTRRRKKDSSIGKYKNTNLMIMKYFQFLSYFIWFFLQFPVCFFLIFRLNIV